MPKANRSLRFCFFSSCREVWGGSEELWSGAARVLASRGHQVTAHKQGVETGHPKFRQLLASGVLIQDIDRYLSSLYPGMAIRLLRRLRLPLPIPIEHYVRRLRKTHPPDLCIVSQGENFDGAHIANACRESGFPYALICQKASDISWPVSEMRQKNEAIYRGAEAIYFVSNHNRMLTERQLGFDLPAARVIRNPLLIGPCAPLPWPGGIDDCLRLACVARLYVPDKGQDMLLDVLSQEHWRKRRLHVTFVGEGVHREALEQCARYLGMENVAFAGQVPDIMSVWRSHHALVLPSRAEGTPLAAVEALACGRPCILTPAGGNSELLADRSFGFLARSVSVEGLNDAMERLWEQRDRLEQMAGQASAFANDFVGHDPTQVLADQILGVAAHLVP